VVFRNHGAEIILGSDQPLKERHPILGGARLLIEKSLRALTVKTGSAPGIASTSPQVMYLPRPRKMPLLAMLVPLAGTATNDLGALLLFWDPQSARVPPASLLTQLFALTEAESLTALATYEGRTPAEIAEGRRRSINTVRTQLRRVFMKCNVRRQAELVKLLAGIANMRSFAEGIEVGIDIGQSAHEPTYQNAVLSCIHKSLSKDLLQSRGTEAVVKVIDFSPGYATPTHYHPHGHEVICVLKGMLKTDYAEADSGITNAGEARYIGENVVHRGHNPSTNETIQVLSIFVKHGEKPFRVDIADSLPK
jgi:DNA-binding CsgD family transcriptional regulator/quercetin dioxygenase-like cupin family protein